ncbi:hypothetical protein [Flavipsychrobacter stenotrophus]|nr:hypothetical protein [Flavipsychrobacter stenotrophus]
MATYEYVYIEDVDVQEIISFMEGFYCFGRREVIAEPNEMQYYEAGNRLFLFRQLTEPRWVEVSIDMDELYELDEIYRRISERFSTRVLFLYKQTTSADARVALFENGTLLRSIHQVYMPHLGDLRIVQNFGNRMKFEEELNLEFPTEYRYATTDTISRTDINSIMQVFGVGPYKTDAACEYIHVEVIKSRN